MRFLEWIQLTGVILHGNISLYLVMKKSSVSRLQRFTYFQILRYALERWIRTPQSNTFGEDKLIWFKSSSQFWTLYTIDGEPMEFEWNMFPGFTTLQLINKVHEFMTKVAIHHNSKAELSSCRCSMTSYREMKTMSGNAMLMPRLCLYLQKDFHQEDGHSSDLDQKSSGILLNWQTTWRMG